MTADRKIHFRQSTREEPLTQVACVQVRPRPPLHTRTTAVFGDAERNGVQLKGAGGVAEQKMHGGQGKTLGNRTAGAQRAGAAPRRGGLEIRQESVDIDLRQFVGLFGFNW